MPTILLHMRINSITLLFPEALKNNQMVAIVVRINPIVVQTDTSAIFLILWQSSHEIHSRYLTKGKKWKRSQFFSQPA